MPLKQRFPSLFRLESDNWCVLADRIETQNDGNLITWDWKRYPATEQEMIEAVECQRLITGTQLSQAEDSWVWSIGDSKDYLVKEVKDWLKSTGSEESVSHVVSDVKSLSFLWYRSRGKDVVVDWIGWNSFILEPM
ncbi:hypothetical protein L1987_75925 [Smallanthus sonchifolius]|uniref:Uncharacterized protein n=1 Tax=Smallanthus sonchifolius TaxID=185202 RepID=A0ACB9A7T0_9ASTR|nr:hypothetical protein L1987_75925 [Smallanthus sonchifolius]